MKKHSRTSAKSKNFLDLVPVKSEKFRYETASDGKVTVFVENKGFFNFVAQKIFKKPRFSQVHFEEFGSFIWPQIDGKKSVKEIAALLSAQFGKKAEPLYPRISLYFKTLLDYGFVEMRAETQAEG